MMTHRQIVLTGGTGALGPALAADLATAGAAERIAVMMRCPPAELDARFEEWLQAVRPLVGEGQEGSLGCLRPVVGDICRQGLGFAESAQGRALRQETDMVIHAAADTSFTAPAERLQAVNVDGSRRMLEWAAECPRLKRFLLVSSVYVSGSRTGTIAETASVEPPGFVTHYQRTKWESEKLGLASGLPVGIARVSLVLGSHATGRIHRSGAIHSLIKWFARGLVPLVPGLPEARGDVIATELAARCLTRAVVAGEGEGGWGAASPPIWQFAAAEAAPRMTEMIDLVYRHFAARPHWRRRGVPKPEMVAQEEFERIITEIEASGRSMVAEALKSVNKYLPDLCFPKLYQTTRAQELWGGPLPAYDWRETLERVCRVCCPAER